MREVLCNFITSKKVLTGITFLDCRTYLEASRFQSDLKLGQIFITDDLLSSECVFGIQ